MSSVGDLYKKIQRINIDSMTELIIKENNKQITELNIDELSKGKNAKGEIVGTYSTLTAQIAAESDKKPLLPKVAGEPYNFVWQGNLLPNIFTNLKNNKLYFDSTGKGTGDKLKFVQKNDLLGLTEENSNVLNYEIILPNLRKKVKDALKL